MPTPNVPSKGKCCEKCRSKIFGGLDCCDCSCHIPPHQVNQRDKECAEVYKNGFKSDSFDDSQVEPPIKEVWEDKLIEKYHKKIDGKSLGEIIVLVRSLLSSHSHEIAERVRNYKPGGVGWNLHQDQLNELASHIENNE